MTHRHITGFAFFSGWLVIWQLPWDFLRQGWLELLLKWAGPILELCWQSHRVKTGLSGCRGIPAFKNSCTSKTQLRVYLKGPVFVKESVTVTYNSTESDVLTCEVHENLNISPLQRSALTPEQLFPINEPQSATSWGAEVLVLPNGCIVLLNTRILLMLWKIYRLYVCMYVFTMKRTFRLHL